MGSEVEVSSCSKDKGKKRVLDYFYYRSHLSLQSQIAFMGSDFAADNPRMNVKLKVTMAEL